MQFASFEFFYFLLGVFLLYWMLTPKWQNVLLLVSSYVFYGAWNWWFLWLIMLSTAVDFIVGRKIYLSKNQRHKRLLLSVSIIINLGILALFKYFNFFIDSFHILMESMGVQVSPVTLNLILPIGISFYTFQTMSYSIDVYRGKIKPTTDMIAFATFVAFFPQLLSGPIERASSLLPQISGKRKVSWIALQGGLLWIMFGLTKKVVIADNLVPFTKPILANPSNHTPIEIILALYTGLVQVYCDFSGYSDMAVGIGMLFGITLSVNFKRPLLSSNPRQFWQRWHVTLYKWVRDYIYIPIARLRIVPRKILNDYFAILVTLTLVGLWHGANWTYLIWGGLLGVLIVGYQILRPYFSWLFKMTSSPALARVVSALIFFHVFLAVRICEKITYTI